eukprot:1989964-Pyramimonas_sp.AAC.1
MSFSGISDSSPPTITCKSLSLSLLAMEGAFFVKVFRSSFVSSLFFVIVLLMSLTCSCSFVTVSTAVVAVVDA